MSYANFVKALELAPQCKFYTTAGGKSDEEIGASEKILGVTFSKQCKEFYKKLGYLSFFGNEIFGIDPYDDSGILEGNSVACAEPVLRQGENVRRREQAVCRGRSHS